MCNDYKPSCDNVRCLTEYEQQRLLAQDARRISEFKAMKLETEAQRNWDIFYKRNGARFFKDRHWTTREFEELLIVSLTDDNRHFQSERKLLEIGCGVGNLVYPLIEEQQQAAKSKSNKSKKGFYFYACDFSPRAVEIVRKNALYDESYITAFQCDITTHKVFDHLDDSSLDVCTMVFVLSAIHPNKFDQVVQNIWRLLNPGGIVLFRDYGRYDMAQLRFKPGNKIADNFYARQDGTRSYYFEIQELAKLFGKNGFNTLSNEYIHRRTLNIKQKIDVPRIFLQAKFQKR